MPTSSDVAELARRRAASWYPELEGPGLEVAVEADRRRPQSELAVVSLRRGDIDRKVLIKRTMLAPVPVGADRPRLGISGADLDRKHQLEWQALRLVWDRLGAGDDPGTRAVRPLDHLEDERVIVLELLTDPTLRDHLLRSAVRRDRAGRERLTAALRRLGRWVAAFHPLAPDVEPRRATPAEVAATAERYGEFLAGRDERVAGLASTVAAAASDLDASSFRLGLGHGDLAPRNVFAAESGEVTVIDPLGRWRLPIEEDLAALLVDLRTAGAQTVLAGRAFPRATVAGFEAAVLEGYAEGSGVPVRRRSLEVHTGVVLLDRWAATLTRPTPTLQARVTMGLVRSRLAAETRRTMAALAE